MYMNDRHVKVLLYLITFSQTLKLKVLVFTCHFFQPTCGVQLSHSYHDIRRCMVLPFFWGNLVWGNDCNSRRFTLHELGFFFFLISRISNSYSVSLLSCATAKSPTGPFHRLLASAVVNRSSFGKYEAPSPFFLLKLLDNFAQNSFYPEKKQKERKKKELLLYVSFLCSLVLNGLWCEPVHLLIPYFAHVEAVFVTYLKNHECSLNPEIKLIPFTFLFTQSSQNT